MPHCKKNLLLKLPWLGGEYGTMDGLGPYAGPPSGFVAAPKAPGTPGAKAVGGGKGRPPGAKPPNWFGMLLSKATGNPGCPVG